MVVTRPAGSYRGLKQLQSVNRPIFLLLHLTAIKLLSRLIAQRHSIDATLCQHGKPLFELIQRRLLHGCDSGGCLLDRPAVGGMLRSIQSGRTLWYWTVITRESRGRALIAVYGGTSNERCSLVCHITRGLVSAAQAPVRPGLSCITMWVGIAAR